MEGKDVEAMVPDLGIAPPNAPAVVYLLSEDAKWVTGHTMVVDAGSMVKPNAGTVETGTVEH